MVSFHRRPVTGHRDSTARDDILRKLKDDFDCQFGFYIKEANPISDMKPCAHADSFGFTCRNLDHVFENPGAKCRVYIFLKISLIDGLLRRDLKSSETMTIQWLAAQTVSDVPSDTSLKSKFLLTNRSPMK